MTHDNILKALHEEAQRAQTTGQKYCGMMALFQAASAENNGIQCDDYRMQLHVLLDSLLDNISTSEMLKRQFMST